MMTTMQVREAYAVASEGPRSHTHIGGQRISIRSADGEPSAIRRGGQRADVPGHGGGKPRRRHLEADAGVDPTPSRVSPGDCFVRASPERESANAAPRRNREMSRRHLVAFGGRTARLTSPLHAMAPCGSGGGAGRRSACRRLLRGRALCTPPSPLRASRRPQRHRRRCRLRAIGCRRHERNNAATGSYWHPTRGPYARGTLEGEH